MEKECRIILKHNNSYLAEIKNLEKSLGEMLICEEKESAWLLSTADENRYKLFKEIGMLEYFNRKKRQWICQEFSDKLFKLFKQYPNEHTIIKKALKISNSTYHRLMKESIGGEPDRRSIKRAERSKKRLNSIEKSLVKLMIAPPTAPLTLNEI